IMLTGDNKHTAAVLASRAGVDSYEADLLPEDKLKCIENIREEGLTVGMVGDGINDSPALAKADIGFAMAKGGTDSAIETADVALMDDDLRKVPSFIRLSRSTITIVIENISFALAVKAVFFVLAFTGYATMWMAVFADVGTSLIVSGNAVRALRK
ncbi:MAG: HAD-IC family P-type ATPase, partial [Desulfovibrio sp.]